MSAKRTNNPFNVLLFLRLYVFHTFENRPKAMDKENGNNIDERLRNGDQAKGIYFIYQIFQCSLEYKRSKICHYLIPFRLPD